MKGAIAASTSAANKSPGRVLVLSTFFAPCGSVGGKRFSFLSRYLSNEFAEYHVLARRERLAYEDGTAFRGNVTRTPMIPFFPPLHDRGIAKRLSRLWAKWLCQVDPFIGWVIPATFTGRKLCKKHELNVVIVTVPVFSSIIAALLIARTMKCRLIIDYRDEWTNHRREFRRPFGKHISSTLERAAIKRASAIVLNTEIMRQDFKYSFGDIAPENMTVIHNGFEKFNDDSIDFPGTIKTNMVYAGNFYGKRKLSTIAPALAELLRTGVISPASFRLHLFSILRHDDYATIAEYEIRDLIEVHEPVPYDTICRIMRAADILFLPSGDEFNYAVPFKFFDYLSVRRPILAVASRKSSVYDLMNIVDCGEFAEFGNTGDVVRALGRLIEGTAAYTYDGADRFKWEHAAAKYRAVIDAVLNK